jgi:SRSO17 transposase
VDLEAFARIEATFQAFHTYFGPAFGRKQWRERSRDYLRGLLVQASERGNAENLAEAIEHASARVLQRFLTEATWDESAVVKRLQEYLGPRLAHPEAVWMVDGSDFPKQGQKSVGVARQYCGALGKVAGCQAGVFLGLSSPRGRALVDKRLFLPEAWTQDPARCEAAGVPREEQRYHAKTDLALAMLRQAKAWGHLQADWVTGDDAFGASPEFRRDLEEEGFRYVLEVPEHLTVWEEALEWVTPPAHLGRGRQAQARPRPGQRQSVRARREALTAEGWQVLTLQEGAQGPRRYRFAFARVRETRRRKPGGVCWLILKENLDGTEPRAFFSNAPAETPEPVLARVAMSRWPIETEFEEAKSQVALDEYEVRSWPGWHHHLVMCLLAGAFLLSLQQEWGGKGAPAHAPAGVPDRLRALAQKALDPRGVALLGARHPAPQREGQMLAREEKASSRSVKPSL